MKILQVAPAYRSQIGGISELIRNISEEMAKNHEVTVFATDPTGKLPKEQEINGVKVKRFRTYAANQLGYFSWKLGSSLMKSSSNFDVVHSHGYNSFLALYAALAKSTNVLIFNPHYHGQGTTVFRNALHKTYRFLGRNILQKADAIVCVSNYEKKLLLSHFKIEKSKFSVIPNGINLREFNGIEKRQKDHRVALSVCRLEEYKGVQFVIEALPYLNKNTTSEIVGNGPYKRNLQRLIRKLRLDERVVFYQNLARTELVNKYSNADIFVLLSKHEAFGISVAEALASRTPCIVANTSALREWVDNENCFGIDYPIDPKKLATLIEKVSNEAEVKKVKLLDWKDVVERLLDLYEGKLKR